MNTTANANLFSRLFDNLDDPQRLAIEELDGTRISYADLIARARTFGRRVLAPRAAKHDREATFPIENFRDMHPEGLLAICVPMILLISRLSGMRM